MALATKALFSVVGARPNFMKMASIHRAIGESKHPFSHRIVHTGQHFSPEMSSEIFDDLQLPKPDFHLDISGGSGLIQIAKGIESLEVLFTKERPDFLLVYGDVNSTAAAAIVASRLGIPIGHVEAGLRSFDRAMPEELNRMLTDSISDYAFTTEQSAQDNLLREGWSGHRIHFVGNTMIDSLVHMLSRPTSAPAEKDPYYLCTLHRPSNVDNPDTLKRLLESLAPIAKKTKIIFPLHPRTKKNIEAFGLSGLLGSFTVTSPLRYAHFVHLLRSSKGIVTDSGGIQEEATFLGVRCLTLRENTERPITISRGTNILLDPNSGDLAEKILAGFQAPVAGEIPPLWDGKAGERILAAIEKVL